MVHLSPWCMLNKNKKKTSFFQHYPYIPKPRRIPVCPNTSGPALLDGNQSRETLTPYSCSNNVRGSEASASPQVPANPRERQHHEHEEIQVSAVLLVSCDLWRGVAVYLHLVIAQKKRRPPSPVWQMILSGQKMNTSHVSKVKCSLMKNKPRDGKKEHYCRKVCYISGPIQGVRRCKRLIWSCLDMRRGLSSI